MPKPSQHELGQWFTPEPVADLALALALRGAKSDAVVLDPSCGDGVFLRRAIRQGIAPGRLYGVDIDGQAAAAARTLDPDLTILEADFFDLASSAPSQGMPRPEVIVGNPPYVRQERLSASQKKSLVDALANDWPTLEKSELESLVARGDLAAPFLLHSLRFLRAGGRAAMVISSAFLDSGYGRQFWSLLAKVAGLRMLVDAPRERWFQDAAVHTMIAVFETRPSQEDVCLARLRCSTREAAQAMVAGAALSEVAELRYASCSQPERWAAALRAPDAWFRAAAVAGDGLTTLGEVAEVRRGLTSGANDIFYLRGEAALELAASTDFLRPLLKAPGKNGQFGIAVDPRACSDSVLVIPPSTELGEHPQLKRYLESFPGASDRNTLAAREPWWALKVRPAQVFLSKAYAQRYVQPYADRAMVADQRVYCVYPKAGVDPAILSALLNSSMSSLALESLGRASMGEGALEWAVGDARHLPIVDPRKLVNAAALRSSFERLRRREIGSVESEAQQSDRHALDIAVLAAWPALQAMREEVQDALVQSCAARRHRSQAGLL